MPTRINKLSARRGDPLVPIDGRRVAAALRWAGKSHADVGKAAGIRRQNVGHIVSGKTRRCHQSVRRAIARLCGSPVTEAYLGGEGIQIPPLRFPPSGKRNHILPFDSNERESGDNSPLPPHYELQALTLASEMERGLNAEKTPYTSLGADIPTPNVGNAMRWMLSLTFWRATISDRPDVRNVSDPTDQEADDFAYHTAMALRILFRPWVERRRELRPHTLRRLVNLLDAIWADNLERFRAFDRGRFADLAILEQLHYFAGESRGELRKHLEEFTCRMRADGLPEDVIAAMIREGDR